MEQNSIKSACDVFNGINSVDIWIRNKTKGAVDSLKSLHPLMQMFFDSELDSETEKEATIGISEAYASFLYPDIVKGLEKKGLGEKQATLIGSAIGHSISYTLGMAKLADKYFRGEISQEEYYYEASKRLQTGLIAFVNNNWDLLNGIAGVTLIAILVAHGIDPVTATSMVSFIGNFSGIIKVKISNLTESKRFQQFAMVSLQYTAKAFSVAIDLTTRVINSIKSFGQKFWNWIRNPFGIQKQVQDTKVHVGQMQN